MAEESSGPGTWAFDRILSDLRTNPPAAPPGFDSLTEIGRGGMGVVYRAREVALDRIVALKVLIAGEDAPEALLERFEREARSAARLSHPNIVEVLGTGRAGPLRWITMRYVEGQSLARMGPLPARQALEITRKVALALAHAHAHRILHRDVKPANVLVDPHGEPQLADFGLAKDLALAGVTVPGERLGTPAFSSPEQLSGDSSRVDARSDVYSLGATLYFMLTGVLPFPGVSAARVAEAVVSQEPTPPSVVSASVPREAEAICLRAMAKDPSMRFDSAREMAEEIERHLGGGTVGAPRRRIGGWAVAIGAVIAGGLGYGCWRLATGGRVVHEERHQDPRDLARRLSAAARNFQIQVAKTRCVSAVLARWAKLRNTLRELDDAAHDMRESRETHLVWIEKLWPAVEAFRQETPADSVSQSAMRALYGWARTLRGQRELGLAEMRAATGLDREVPLGRLMEALMLLADYSDSMAMPAVELTPSGVEFTGVPAETESRADLRKRIAALLADAKTAPIWGKEGASDLADAVDGLAAVHEGNFTRSEKALSEAITSPDLLPFQTGLLLARGRVRYLAKEFDAALEDFHEVEAAREGDPDPRFDTSECAVAAATARAWRGEDPLPLLGEAIDAYSKVIEWDPSRPMAHERRGHARRERGEATVRAGRDPKADYAEAVKDLEQGLAKGADAEPTLLELGNVYVARGHWEASRGSDFRLSYTDAIAAYDILLKRGDANADAWLARGAAHADLGRALMQRGMDCEKAYEEAVEDIDRGLRIRPRDAIALTNRGAAWIGLGSAKHAAGKGGAEEYRKAIADFDAALVIDKEYTTAYLNRAGAYGSLGNAQAAAGEAPWESYDRALADCGEALKRNATVATTWNNRAMLWHVIGDARKASGKDPAEAYTHALADFAEAIQRNPSLWIAYLGQGQVREKTGDSAGAASSYERAYAIVGDKYPGLPEMIRKAKENAQR